MIQKYALLRHAGFTLTELLVTLGIFSILVSIIVVNVLHAPAQASLTTSVSIIAADMKSQQLRSMLGDTENTANPKTFGIYFQNNQYTLFASPYNANDTSNFTVTMNADIQLTPTFPSNQLIFNRVSGEVSGFSVGANTVTVLNTSTNEEKTITVNQYGVVTIN